MGICQADVMRDVRDAPAVTLREINANFPWAAQLGIDVLFS